MNKEDDFLKKLIDSFNIESKERIQRITHILLKLEKNENAEEKTNLIEEGFREVHSLKGGSRAVNFTEIEKNCQQMEDIFHELKKNKMTPTTEQLDELHKLNDIIIKWIESGSMKDIKDPTPGEQNRTVRMNVEKLDTLFVQAEEMLSVKLNLRQKLEHLNDLKNRIYEARKEFEKQDSKLLLESTDALLKELGSKITVLSSGFEQELHHFGVKLSNLLEDTKKILMLPFSTLLNIFPKIVRDLSRTQNKEIEFKMEGSEIEIDKRILEGLKDVLMHLVRNAIDHGIETNVERQNLKKPLPANLSISVKQISGNEILIEIKDDGSGINLEKVKQAALKKGIITSEIAKNLSKDDNLKLIFHSGVSTSPIVTDLSGRGLGMAIIQEKIEALTGTLSIQTEQNCGTTLQIRLPLGLATFKGTLIKSSGENFIIPTAHLERILRIEPDKINRVENKEMIMYDGKTTSLVWLSDVLGLSKSSQSKNPYLQIIIISNSEKKLGFVIDEILSEQEIIVKNFSKPLSKIKNISAAAILGKGKPIPILNTSDLLNSNQLAEERSLENTSPQEVSGFKHILLVEDSITTRNLLKNILELSGYNVTTAVDGLDAWELIKQNDFSLVVSDVDMPRMNGFTLTEKIRAEDKISNMPIILVTARETEEDKAKGIEVGADAYLTKSTFDSSLMLEMIARFASVKGH